MFAKQSKQNSEKADNALKTAQQALKIVLKDADDKNKAKVKQAIATEKMEEKEKAEAVHKENEEKENNVKEQVKKADELQKAAVADRKELDRMEEAPKPGEKLTGPPLINREPILEGEPCKVFMQATFDGPCSDMRGFSSKIGCASGLTCGPDRDIGAISYYTKGAVSTDISGSVLYCTAPKTKLVTP